MRTNPTTPQAICPARARRGVAMMLAIVALAVGTGIAAAALTLNDNSARIGQNAVSQTSSEWSGHAAAELVVASMQTEKDWKSLVTGGKLLENWTVADSTVDVIVTNLEGGDVAQSDREVLLTIVSDSNGVRTVIEKQVSISEPTTFGEEIDSSLGEFAVYAHDSLSLLNGSKVGVWPKSPEASSRPEVKVGTGAKTTSMVNIDGSVELRDVRLFVNETATLPVRNLPEDAMFAGGRALPDIIPLCRHSLSEDEQDMRSADFSVTENSGGNAVLKTNGYAINNVVVSKGSSLVLEELTQSAFVVNNMMLTDAGVLVVDGDIRLVVKNEFRMTGFSAIELVGDSTLTMLVGGNFSVQNSVIGLDRSVAQDSTRSLENIAEYQPSDRISISSINGSNGGNADALWRLIDRSMVVASLDAPNLKVAIANSMLIGRATASAFEMDNNALLAYDPALDNRMGFTDPMSPIYDGATVRAEYRPTIYLTSTLPNLDSKAMSPQQELLLEIYEHTEDEGAFVREVTSILLNQDLRQTGDSVENPFVTVAVRMIEDGAAPMAVASAVDALMSDIAPGTGVDALTMLSADSRFYDALSELLRSVLGLSAPPTFFETPTTFDTPTIDALGPNFRGNFTVRRQGKARARSIEDLASVIEAQ